MQLNVLHKDKIKIKIKADEIGFEAWKGKKIREKGEYK